MPQFLSLFKTLVSLLPTLAQAVRLIEEAVPAGGQGAKKLEVVREALQASYAATQDLTTPLTSLWPVIERTVAALVKLITK